MEEKKKSKKVILARGQVLDPLPQTSPDQCRGLFFHHSILRSA